MKNFLVFLALALLALRAHGQGTLSFQNMIPPAPVTNFITGARVAPGTTFSIQLYAAPDGETNEHLFQPVGATTTFSSAGFFVGGSRTIPTATAGGMAMVQVRIWEAAYGATYEAAYAASPMNGRRAIVARSVVSQIDTANPVVQPPETPVNFPAGALKWIGLALADGEPLLTVNNIVVAEGTNGTATATYTVSLGAASVNAVAVDFATEDGTALAGQDYVATHGTLTFNPGELHKSVSVTVIADMPPEPDEEFYLHLSNPVNAMIATETGTCIITEVMVTGIRVDAVVSINTVLGHRYIVERSDDLHHWTTVSGAENILATGSILSVTDAGAGCDAARVYRARLLE